MVPWVLAPPLAVLLGLEGGLHFRLAVGLSTCSFVVPSFARESAASLPGKLQWEGIQCPHMIPFICLFETIVS